MPLGLLGQSLHFSTEGKTANNNPTVFSLSDDNKVEIRSNSITFMDSGKSLSSHLAAGFSPDRSIVGVLNSSGEQAEISLLSASGDTLNSYSSISIKSNDPSLDVYPLNSGALLLRSNIMNFAMYDGYGNTGTTITSGSNSEEGETISEVRSSTDGATTIIFTPKIKRGEQLGSKVDLLDMDNQLVRIFEHQERFIKELQVSEDGKWITIITGADGTNDRVLVMDRYGNEIGSFSPEEELEGAELSRDASHITLFSSKRVRVYNVLSGERLGSTSIQDPAFYADFFPEDQMILILSGDYSDTSGILNSAEIKAVDLARRDIVSNSLSEALGFYEGFEIDIIRLSSNQYKLKGANKELTINVSF
jgi:hypothetical protein